MHREGTDRTRRMSSLAPWSEVTPKATFATCTEKERYVEACTAYYVDGSRSSKDDGRGRSMPPSRYESASTSVGRRVPTPWPSLCLTRDEVALARSTACCVCGSDTENAVELFPTSHTQYAFLCVSCERESALGE